MPVFDTFRYTDSHAFMDKVRGGMPPLMICVACNGGVQGKEANEAIPKPPTKSRSRSAPPMTRAR